MNFFHAPTPANSRSLFLKIVVALCLTATSHALPLAVEDWQYTSWFPEQQQAPGPNLFEETATGLKFYDYSPSSGGGARIESIQASFYLPNSTLYVKWKVTSNAWGYFSIYFPGNTWNEKFTWLSTGSSFAGTTIISSGTWYYTKIDFDSQLNFTSVTSSGSYSDQGGTVVQTLNGMPIGSNDINARIAIAFEDTQSANVVTTEIDEVNLVVRQPNLTVAGNSVPIQDGATQPAVGNHTDFGLAGVEAGVVLRTFTLANDGALDLLLADPVTLSGSSSFSISEQPDASIAPAGQTSLSILFNPTSSGIHTATVTVPSNDPDNEEFTFAIQGTGTQATLSVRQDSVGLLSGRATVSFEPTDVGRRSKPISFAMHNIGTENLVGLSASVTGRNGRDFLIAGPRRKVLPPSGITMVVSYFRPLRTGVRTGIIEIRSNSSRGLFRVNVRGRGK